MNERHQPEDIKENPDLFTFKFRIRNGEEVTLRPLRPNDAESLGNYFVQLKEATTSLFAPHPFDHETAQKVCAEHNPEKAVTLIVTVP